MILIYEYDDLKISAKSVALRDLAVSHVKESRRQGIAESQAGTIYIEVIDSGLCMMVKQRNGPLDPYPCIIEYKRARF